MTEHSSIASYAISLAVNLTLIGAFFIAGLTLAFRSLGSASPRARYMIALAVFFAAALLPTVITFAHSRQVVQLSVPATTVRAEHLPSAVPRSDHKPPAPIDSSIQSEESSEGFSSAKEPLLNEKGGGAALFDTVVSLAAGNWVGTSFLALWAVVCSLLIAREMAGHIRLAKARRGWRPADDKTRVSLAWPGSAPLYISACEGPWTVGGFRPVVVIPARLLDDMSPDAARVIARHELAHARWRDPLANALLRIIRAVLWPGLPLWHLERMVRAEREVAADRFAVDALPGSSAGDAVEYAALLVSIARRSHREAYRWKFGAVATEAGGGTNFEYRVRRLLMPEAELTRARVLLATLAMLLCTCGAAFVPVTARPIRIAFLSGDDHLTAYGKVMEGSATATGQRQPDGKSSHGETQMMTGIGQQSMTANFTREGTAGGEVLELDSKAQPDPEHEKSIRQDLTQELAALGYSDLSPDQVAAVKTYGVSQAYVKELALIGYGNLTADALINFRSLGVSPAYIREMRGLGYGGLTANTIIDFRLYGVTSAYIGEMAALGFSNIPAKTLVAFRRSGINAEYVSQIRSAVASSVLADELLALRRHGVTASYVRELKAKGHERLTVNQLIELRSGNGAGGGS